MQKYTLSGNIVDLISRTVFPGQVVVANGKIESISRDDSIKNRNYILPGFIDAHVHIESSILVPSEFARLAVVHGTVATVSDPHEIANVLGVKGVRYMTENAQHCPFHFYFGAPSCVPATPFETAGATLTSEDIHALLHVDKLKYLSEMMNYPAVIVRDPLVMDKIAVAKQNHVPVDGHAPGLKDKEAMLYCSAGISTDHECFTLQEALGKIQNGMKIIIREGSAAKNYEALHSLIRSHPDKVMFCSDDKHPHELVESHINKLVVRSIVQHGYDVMDVLRAACYNPIIHYNLDVGYLQKGQSADFIVVDSLDSFTVLQTFVKGELVAENGKTYLKPNSNKIINQFNAKLKSESDFHLEIPPAKRVRVIQAFNGELITKKICVDVALISNKEQVNVEQDILKLVVVNRYCDAPVAIGYVRGFGLKRGALASSIAHDSHNIIAVGTSDAEIVHAVNALIREKGGIAASVDGMVEVLPLPVAGIMSPDNGYEVANRYLLLDKAAKALGSKLDAPFMTLSFMALLVIPSLKLSDKGLFDGDTFSFVSLFE